MPDYDQIRRAFDTHTLFDDKTWRLSPEAWPLTREQVSELRDIGQACYDFHKALEMLYARSVAGKNLLRNRELKAPWVADYLDRGKPEGLIEHARSKRNRGILPSVIRPDLLCTEDGFALTEIDSVPGGIGLTAFLNRLYENGDPDRIPGEGENGGGIIGSGDRMVMAFYESLAALAPEKSLPLIAILVSDEAATYRPEMEWLAAQLRLRGRRVYCFHPKEIMPLGTKLCADLDGNPEQVDIVYRFWELFDLASIPIAEYIVEAWEESELLVSPPMRHFQEEKLSLALFHHHILGDYWREALPKRSCKLLKKLIPQSWIMDPVDLPPNAVLDAPPIGGGPIRRWEELANASQKEREFIIKLSGFHENAWGARSVTYGRDASRTEWEEAIGEALVQAPRNLSILQEYRKPIRLRHPVYAPPTADGENATTPDATPRDGRLRLCPYYFVQGEKVELTGVLATFCPADKKIIHGMTDAALLPCREV